MWLRRSCNGQTRVLYIGSPCWPSCEMMMCSFASDRLSGRIMGTLAAGYDKRCTQDRFVTELSNRTGFAQHIHFTINLLLITIVACIMCLCTIHPLDVGVICTYIQTIHPLTWVWYVLTYDQYIHWCGWHMYLYTINGNNRWWVVYEYYYHILQRN